MMILESMSNTKSKLMNKELKEPQKNVKLIRTMKYVIPIIILLVIVVQIPAISDFITDKVIRKSSVQPALYSCAVYNVQYFLPASPTTELLRVRGLSSGK